MGKKAAALISSRLRASLNWLEVISFWRALTVLGSRDRDSCSFTCNVVIFITLTVADIMEQFKDAIRSHRGELGTRSSLVYVRFVASIHAEEYRITLYNISFPMPFSIVVACS